MSKPGFTKIKSRAISLVNLLLMAACFVPLVSYAQQSRDGRVMVTGVSVRAVSSGTVVSIAADGPLSQAQTWQDSEGYHVVIPAASTRNNIKAGSGVKLRQLGSSIEILVQTKPGSNVSVQSLSNHLTLTVEGKLEPRAVPRYVDDPSKSAEELALSQGDSQRAEELRQAAAARANARLQATSGDPHNSGPAVPGDGAPAANANVPATGSPAQSDDSSFPDYWVWILVVGGVLLLLAALKLRARRAAAQKNLTATSDDGFEPFDEDDDVGPAKNRSHTVEHQAGHAGQTSTGATLQKRIVSVPVATAALFGAYRVDQEVGKLVMGQAHRMDVLGSRSLDDRRAIEASLLKAMNMADVTAEERRRVASALEEYGFVARQSALLLLAPDPYDRTSAAKLLGDFKSPASLPFLLEALYDHESIVRHQAVLSIGELKLPSAIGALLDLSRRHPEVPGSLLTRALTSCSVEGLDFFDSPIPEPSLLSGHHTETLAHEFTQLEPASAVEDLPDLADDERLTKALSKLESADLAERSDAIKVAAQFAVRSSVSALGKVARLDSQASIRALAISSLATINHESVFPAVLIGMADESREVRAAAARSLSRLSFDRADAYVRVMETHDSDALRDVAQACIKAGIVSQGIDRLASSDRRQVYEAFSIVSLLAKANMIEPILDAIANHPNIDLRLTAIRLLGTTGQPAILEQLRELSKREEIPEFVRSALLETMPRTDESQHEESQTSVETPVAADGDVDEP